MLIPLDNNKGIGLVEAVLAIAFAIVMVVALLSLTTFNVQNSFNVTQRQEASKNSSILLERLRAEKDSNFESFASRYVNVCSSKYCNLTQNQNQINPCTPARETSCFKVSTEPGDVLPIKKLKIEVVSFYEQNKLLFSSATETIFANWRTRQ